MSINASEITLTIPQPQGQIIGTGPMPSTLATCRGVLIGDLTGPLDGDRGDWDGLAGPKRDDLVFIGGELLLGEPLPGLSNTDLNENDPKDVSGFDLSNTFNPNFDYSGFTFVSTDLSNSAFTNTSFIGADLRSTNFSNSDLSGANFSGATFSGTSFEGSILAGASFEGADLKTVILTNAMLTKANLRGVDLRGVDLRGANLSNTDLSNVRLTGAILFSANLSGAVLLVSACCSMDCSIAARYCGGHTPYARSCR